MRSRALAVALCAWLAGGAAACDERTGTRSPEPVTGAAPDSGPESDASAPARPTVELPLKQLSSNHIVIPFAIGSREPMSFILDTGASTSVISRETQELLGYRDEDGTPVKGQGANGALSDVRLFSLPDARVGERVYRDLSVAVMDLRHLQDKLDQPVAGILGRNFLARHDLEIDFVGGRLLLHDSAGVETGKVDVSAMAASEYGNLVGGLIGIQVSIDGGQSFPAVLDLGAARSVINWHAARAVGLSPESKRLADSPEALLGADNTPIETKFITFERIAIGGAEIQKPTVYIADLGVFQTLGVADGPAMVFGVDMLSRRSIVIDYQSQQVYISKGGA